MGIKGKRFALDPHHDGLVLGRRGKRRRCRQSGGECESLENRFHVFSLLFGQSVSAWQEA